MDVGFIRRMLTSQLCMKTFSSFITPHAYKQSCLYDSLARIFIGAGCLLIALLSLLGSTSWSGQSTGVDETPTPNLSPNPSKHGLQEVIRGFGRPG